MLSFAIIIIIEYCYNELLLSLLKIYVKDIFILPAMGFTFIDCFLISIVYHLIKKCLKELLYVNE
nr:hypothetical protein B11C_110454 [Bartonella sp. 1-1C]